jgi:hypothetical protein
LLRPVRYRRAHTPTSRLSVVSAQTLTDFHDRVDDFFGKLVTEAGISPKVIGWPDLLPDEKRTIVENVVQRITIGNGDVEIDVAYIPSRSEMGRKRQRGHNDSLLSTSQNVPDYPYRIYPAVRSQFSTA